MIKKIGSSWGFVFRVCLLTALVFVILMILGREVFIRYTIMNNKENPTSIISSFAFSLYKHDYRMANALSDPQLWPEIQNWLDEHEQVKCPWAQALSGDEGQGEGVVALVSDEAENFYSGNYYVSMICPDPKHYYCLEIPDITVKQNGEQWIVTEVGSIKEFWSAYGCN